MANYKHKGIKMKLGEALEIIDIIKDINNETFKKYFDTNMEVLVGNSTEDLAVAKFLRDLGFELIKTIETGQNERF